MFLLVSGRHVGAHPDGRQHWKKTSVAPEQKRLYICNFSRTDVVVKMEELRKGSNLLKEKKGSPTTLDSKLLVKLTQPVLARISSLARLMYFVA